MKIATHKRMLSVLLALALVLQLMVPGISTAAANDQGDQVSISFEEISADGYAMDGLTEADDVPNSESDQYADTDMVRVSIVLEGESTLKAGFSTLEIAGNAQAMRYRAALEQEQAEMTAVIERKLGMALDVAWNLTLAANIISANVPYGMIGQIEDLNGVEAVVLETRYEPAVYSVDEEAGPETATSGEMIGTAAAYAAGYTGAGSRIAVIDTGIDTDHQSFSAVGFQYSLAYQAGRTGLSVEEYKESLNLLDAEEIASKLELLNIEADPDALYVNSKIPFGYNYIDGDLDITHDNDNQGEHGSHVEGIAAANAYIQNENGTFSKALDTVYAQGVAPDAQIIAMKVFGKNGGAYESDYMAAIEDAIILGCDSINLSLGTASHGFGYSSIYEDIMDSLTESDTVVTISGGNNGGWADNAVSGVPYLYANDVSMYTGGAPGAYTNSLAVASVDNDGTVGNYFTVGDISVFYNDGQSSKNAAMATLEGELEYVLIDSIGTAEEFAAVADVLAGKVAVCSRGTTSFYEKANAAVKNGAVAVIIANNTAGIIYLNLSGYSYTAPVVSITQADGLAMKEAATAVTDEEGNVLYYLGSMTMFQELGSTNYFSDYYTMSSFSSWGVPGSLELKPEITAPGGSIWSVNGADESGTAYEVMSGTSMAAPQVAGMAAVVAQYIRENGLEEQTGLSSRTLAMSLLMSTAVPMLEEESGGNYYPVLRQGSGLANAGNAVTAQSYILMNEDATESWADGKVKAELGDDPERTGEYSFSFTVNNMSGTEQTYTLAADFFTQGIFSYYGLLFMDTWTMSLPMEVTFLVDGQEFVPVSSVDCDLDGDGDTDADDAQIIISYCAGASETIDAIADVDGSGEVTTYDAFLILDSMETRVITVAAGGQAEIEVKAVMPASVKNFLDAYYTGGAYVEGYVYVLPTADAEGAILDVTHSIPVLGFYGSWTDGSMYEDITYTDYLYQNYTVPYTGYVSNNLIIKYAGDSNSYWQIGNPYFIENTYKPERAAISSTTTLSSYPVGLIRNADAMAVLITDQDGNILMLSDVTNRVNGAWYYENYGSWQSTTTEVSINKKVSALGVSEGDTITVSVVAVPEYYQTEGALTTEQVEELITSGALGDGAYMSTTLTVDDTAPVISDIYKDMTTGSLVVTASDNNYIAAVQVTSVNGKKTYGYGLPYQTEAGQLCGVEIDLSGSYIGEEAVVLVADYANNISAYRITYGGEGEDFSGRMFGFTATNLRDTGNRWMELDPETISYQYGDYIFGAETVAKTDIIVTAAEYVEGYVFMAGEDGKMYVAPQEDLSDYSEAGSFADTTAKIWDMAFNYTDNKLYAVGENSVVYTVDLVTGALTEAFTVSLKNPATSSATARKLLSLAIDGDGNFYGINSGSSWSTFLYKWSKEDIVDGAVTDLTPVVNSSSSDLDFYSPLAGNLAWDHTTGTLYWCCSQSTSYSSSNNVLLIVNVETGKAVKANNYSGVTSSTYTSRTGDAFTGFYIVPGSTDLIPSSTSATSITLDITEISVLKGSNFTLSETVYPWNLEDKSVTWTSSDESVALVDSGSVTAVGVGTVVITATTNAAPFLEASCTVTVSQLGTVEMTGLVYDVDSSTYWSDFTTDDPAAWTAVSGESGSFIGGTMLDGMIYAHNGSTMYAVDPNTFEATSMGAISSTWIWSDAAPAPVTDDGKAFGLTTAICYNGTYLELVNVPAGTLNYFNLSSTFSGDPMAAIAYAGSGTYTVADTSYITGETYPTCNYYILTEGGNVWYLSIYAVGNNADFEICEQTYICNVNVSLDGVSAVTAGAYASMIYDEVSGCLILASYTEGDTARLYALDMENAIYADLGSFGEDIWPVVSLYQYQRPTDLTVSVAPKAVELYQSEQSSLTASVLPGSFTGGVVWSSSDETVATVDANGVVTGVGEGTAVITATSVDVNAAGETVSADATVHVSGLAQVDITFKGQVTTESGSSWATINTADLSTYTVDGTANVTLKGGGAHEGELWGHSVETGTWGSFSTYHFYSIDAETYETQYRGWTIQGEDVDDLTTAPAYKLLTKDSSGNQFYTEALGLPLYVSNAMYVELIKTDYVDDYYSQLYMYTGLRNYADLAAISFVGMTESTGYTSELFYILCSNGDLLQLIIEMRPTTIASDGYYQRYWRGSLLGNIGVDFTRSDDLSMVTINDGTNFGLMIAESGNGKGELFYVDLTEDSWQAKKVGTLEGVTYLTSLYTDYEIGFDNGEGDAAVEAVETEGTALSASAGLLLCETYMGEAQSEEPVAAVNAAGGSTNAVSAEAVYKEHPATALNAEAQVADNTVSVILTDTEAVTNGVMTVTYDPAVLRYADTVSPAAVSGVSVDEENGVVTVAYANAGILNAGATLATVNFTYTADYIDTQVTVATLERNQITGISGETVTLELTYEVGGHDYQLTESQAATCTEDGWNTWTCSKCGDSYTEELAALGHSYGCETTPATCTEAGCEVYTCEHCGDSYTVALPALGHSYEVTTATATCTTAGYTLYRCACGSEYMTDLVEATGHDYTVEVVEPTCTEHGYTVYTCACGHSYISDFVAAHCGSAKYADVAAESWYHEAIDFVVDSGLMNGVSENLFDPSGVMNRAQLVTVLYRMAGSPEVEEPAPFTDVPADSFYADAVTWAYANGIANGVSTELFAPDASITREQMVTFLARFAEKNGMDVTAASDLSAYEDAGQVSAWAVEAFAWAVENGLVKGVTETTLEPAATTNRAQVATVLMRFVALGE